MEKSEFPCNTCIVRACCQFNEDGIKPICYLYLEYINYTADNFSSMTVNEIANMQKTIPLYTRNLIEQFIETGSRFAYPEPKI